MIENAWFFPVPKKAAEIVCMWGEIRRCSGDTIFGGGDGKGGGNEETRVNSNIRSAVTLFTNQIIRLLSFGVASNTRSRSFVVRRGVGLVKEGVKWRGSKGHDHKTENRKRVITLTSTRVYRYIPLCKTPLTPAFPPSLCQKAGERMGGETRCIRVTPGGSVGGWRTGTHPTSRHPLVVKPSHLLSRSGMPGTAPGVGRAIETGKLCRHHPFKCVSGRRREGDPTP